MAQVNQPISIKKNGKYYEVLIPELSVIYNFTAEHLEELYKQLKQKYGNN